MAIRVAIIGAGGYTGAELVSLLAAHPGVDLVGLFGGKTTAGSRMSDLHPRLRSICDDVVLPSEPTTIAAASPDVVFLATPHEASHDLAPVLLEQGWIVIDLSAAFRLSDPAQYPIHYRFEHRYPELLSSAVYGLPELNRDELRSADLIAAPGCYATAATLAIAPFAQAGQISSGTRPIIDGVSGVSGAGRTPNERTHFCNISLQPYAVGQHRHTPEIAEHARTPVVFTPHLAEYERGILATTHIELADGVTSEAAADTLTSAYAQEPFVRFMEAGQWPAVANVRRTNFCDVGSHVDDDGHLIVVTAIDNLVKGASGQAVQCMNVRMSLPETLGLLPQSGQLEEA